MRNVDRIDESLLVTGEGAPVCEKENRRRRERHVSLARPFGSSDAGGVRSRSQPAAHLHVSPVKLDMLLLLLSTVANDPAGSWLSYARWDAPDDGVITSLNTSWYVPSNPSTSRGSNAPGWWYGVQTKDGDGALIQPILAYGYQGAEYTMFNGVFDWTDGSWHTSPEKYTVQPGDLLTSSVVFNEADNSYTMVIASTQTGKSISTTYNIERRQTKPESTAYFVLEHQPSNCAAYPADGVATFMNVSLAVNGKVVASPQWQALQEQPACNSQATIVDPATIKFTWDTKAAAPTRGELPNARRMKWPAFDWRLAKPLEQH